MNPLDFGDYFVQKWHVVFFDSKMPKILVWTRTHRFIELKISSNFANSQWIFCNYQTLYRRAPKNKENSIRTSTRRGLGRIGKFWFHIFPQILANWLEIIDFKRRFCWGRTFGSNSNCAEKCSNHHILSQRSVHLEDRYHSVEMEISGFSVILNILREINCGESKSAFFSNLRGSECC